MNFDSAHFVAWIAAILLSYVLPAQAAVFEAEGVAAIKPAGPERAREMAIKEAIDQVANQAGLEVRGESRVDSQGIPLESSRVRATVKVGEVRVIREWQDDDHFHVRISAVTEQSNYVMTATRKYKKKITATPFLIRKQYQINDIDNLSSGFSRELMRRLADKNEFLTRNSRDVIAMDSNGLRPDPMAMMELAQQNDSQFIVSGEIVDAGNSQDGKRWFGTDKRWFELDLVVYDGLTGSLIARHRLGEFAEGNVLIGHEKPFASKSFLATPYGQAINKTIDAAAEMITVDLERIPFAAKVIRVENGQVYVNVGGTSLLAPGDRLVVYHKETRFSTSGFGSSQEYGITETPVATVSIVQVQPLFSIGTLLTGGKNASVEAGDLVRFDFAGQSRN